MANSTYLPSIFARPWHLLYFIYFFTHIPASILIDARAVITPFFPGFPPKDVTQFFVENWVNAYQDKLMETFPVWFLSLVHCEILFQLPFFFVACYALIVGGNWCRIPFIIYCSHVMTTLIPILASYIFEYQNYHPVLIGTNAIYFFVPLFLLINMVMYEKPFDYERPKIKQ